MIAKAALPITNSVRIGVNPDDPTPTTSKTANPSICRLILRRGEIDDDFAAANEERVEKRLSMGKIDLSITTSTPSQKSPCRRLKGFYRHEPIHRSKEIPAMLISGACSSTTASLAAENNISVQTTAPGRSRGSAASVLSSRS